MLFRFHTPKGRYFCAAAEEGVLVVGPPNGICRELFDSREASVCHALQHTVVGKEDWEGKEVWWVPKKGSLGKVLGGQDDMCKWTPPGWICL